EGPVLSAAVDGETLRESEVVDSALRRAAVGERTEIGEGQGRRSAVNGTRGSALNAEGRGQIGAVRKERRGEIAIAVEGRREVLEDSRSESVPVVGGRIDAIAARRIDETVILQVLRIAALPVNSETELIAARQSLIHTRVEVLAVVRNGFDQ